MGRTDNSSVNRHGKIGQGRACAGETTRMAACVSARTRERDPAPRLPGAEGGGGFGAVLRGAVLAATLAALGGCAAPQPWVKPYEREKLADPVMALTRNPMMDAYRQHVFDVREGARGATDSDGGGCGCN